MVTCVADSSTNTLEQQNCTGRSWVCPQNGNLPNTRTQVFYNSLKGTIQKATSAEIETGREKNPKLWESQPCQEALTSNKRSLFHLQLQK